MTKFTVPVAPKVEPITANPAAHRSIQRSKAILARGLAVGALFVSVGCSPKAWVIEKSGNSGLIGYRPDLSEEEKQNQFKRLIPCENPKILEDQVKSERVPVDQMPVTVQNSHDLGESLGQNPTAGSLGSYKYSISPTALPVVRSSTDTSFDTSHGEARFECP